MNKFLSSLLSFAIAIAAHAQQGNALTAKDYEHAENFLSYNTESLVDRDSVRPHWLPGDRFWYRILTARGSEFIFVDPAKRTRMAAFDQQKLASALSTVSGKNYEASHLPFQAFRFSPDDRSISFLADGKQWKCDLQNYLCTMDTARAGDSDSDIESGYDRRSLRGNRRNDVVSPDGKRTAYIKEYNLWVRNISTNHRWH